MAVIPTDAMVNARHLGLPGVDGISAAVLRTLTPVRVYVSAVTLDVLEPNLGIPRHLGELAAGRDP